MKVIKLLVKYKRPYVSEVLANGPMLIRAWGSQSITLETHPSIVPSYSVTLSREELETALEKIKERENEIKDLIGVKEN